MENQIANVEFQGFSRDQRLLTELSEYQARLSQESAIVGNCRTETTAMQNAYRRELDVRTRAAADQLTGEFAFACMSKTSKWACPHRRRNAIAKL